MSKPFLRFEDGKISLGGKDLMVRSASLSISPQLNPERVYGDFDVSIVGAKTEFINFSPSSNLKGELQIKFFISASTFAEEGSLNTIDRLFEIKEGMSENPVNRNIVGRYSFDNMFLKSFSFSLSPFSVIEASATYDIYGTIYKIAGTRFQKLDMDFAHSLKSFGSMKASGSSAPSQFEIASLKYNITVKREMHNSIRSSEHSSVGTHSSGVVPARVSVREIESEMNIECNEMISHLNPYGDQQLISSPEGIENSTIEAFLYDIHGVKIARFKTSGKIHQQSYSIEESKQASGSITIREVVK